MLQKGIHIAIVEAIIFCCKNVSSERKRVWSEEEGYIYDHDTWISAGRPRPVRTLSPSRCPEIHPLTILRILKDFFGLNMIKDRLLDAITRRPRENIEMIMGSSWIGRRDTTMELFNGKINGGIDCSIGLTIGNDLYHTGPASRRFLTTVVEGDVVTPEDINEYYKRWDCEGDFVHEKNIGVGYKYQNMNVDLGPGVAQNFNSHNFSSVYGGIPENIRNDHHPYLLQDNTIVNLSKPEKLTYINMFLKKLCAEYHGEEGNSHVDRATWYEVSEFINFYYDIWSSFDTIDGDEECWESEHITSGSLTYKNHESSTMYEIPGVWHHTEGGKWSQNFETIMKIQTNDWMNSIWKKKYDMYIQRISEEGLFVYTTIYSQATTSLDEIEEGVDSREEWVNSEGGWVDSGEHGRELIEELVDDGIDEITNREKVISIMDYLFENTENIPEGIYIELCNRLKDLNRSL